MTNNSNSKLLKISLIIFIIVALLYGFVHLFIPQVNVEASGGDPVPSGWLRWMGGILLSLGIGGIMVYMKPKGQRIFVTTLVIGSLLAGLALIFSALFEPEGIGDIMQTLIPGIILVILGVLLWISLKQSKELLTQ